MSLTLLLTYPMIVIIANNARAISAIASEARFVSEIEVAHSTRTRAACYNSLKPRNFVIRAKPRDRASYRRIARSCGAIKGGSRLPFRRGADGIGATISTKLAGRQIGQTPSFAHRVLLCLPCRFGGENEGKLELIH